MAAVAKAARWKGGCRFCSKTRPKLGSCWIRADEGETAVGSEVAGREKSLARDGDKHNSSGGRMRGVAGLGGCIGGFGVQRTRQAGQNGAASGTDRSMVPAQVALDPACSRPTAVRAATGVGRRQTVVRPSPVSPPPARLLHRRACAIVIGPPPRPMACKRT